VLQGLGPEALLSEQRKRDADAAMHWAVRVVPLGILLGLVSFGIITLISVR
jgi:hypothetical protein